MNIKDVKVVVKNRSLLPRSGHKIVADDVYLYLVGGFVEFKSENFNTVNEVRGEIWRFHFVFKTWEKLIFNEDIFTLAASHSATLHGDCIFITGGTGLPFGRNILNNIIVIDIKKMVQKKYQFNPKNNNIKNMPIATYGHSVTLVDLHSRPHLFIMGGTTGNNYHQEVYRIDLLSLESSLVSDGDATNCPQPRYKHEAFLYKDEIWVIGGTTQSDISFNLDRIHSFHVHTNKWSSHTTNVKIDVSLRCPSMCQNGQYIYLTGGLFNPETISPAVYQLDIASLSWSRIGSWDRPCFFHDSVFVPQFGSLFTFGGVYQQAPARRSNELHQFQPSLARARPSLADLAWHVVIDLVMNYRASMQPQSISNPVDPVTIYRDLHRIGLPDSLIKRIDVRDLPLSNAA